MTDKELIAKLKDACISALEDVEWHQSQDADLGGDDPEDVAYTGSIPVLKAAIAEAENYLKTH